MDIKTFKKTFILICDECGKFAHTKTDYCEVCGAQALREATNEDYMRIEMEKISDAKEQQIGLEKAEETRMVTERAEKVSEKARIVAEKAEKKAEKAAEKAKGRAKKTKEVAEDAEDAANKARTRVERTKEKAKTKAEKS